MLRGPGAGGGAAWYELDGDVRRAHALVSSAVRQLPRLRHAQPQRGARRAQEVSLGVALAAAGAREVVRGLVQAVAAADLLKIFLYLLDTPIIYSFYLQYNCPPT